MSTQTAPVPAPRQSAGTPAPFDASTWRVTRGTLGSRISLGGFVIVVAVLAYVPLVYTRNVTTQLVQLFVLILLASMWNVLAGYGGMISVGQQAFVGFGSYTVLYCALHGINPWVAVLIGGITSAALAVPVSFLVFRLRGGYFAIGTWVVSEVLRLTISQSQSLGGGAGARLPAFGNGDPDLRQATTYWLALGLLVVTLVVVAIGLRTRSGTGLTAVRDNEVAAGALGVRVSRIKRFVFVLASAGCGIAGGLLLTDQLVVQPDSAFSVQFSAEMIFMVVIGGVGTLEGPVIGAIVFFEVQHQLSAYGAWYLIALGAVAVVLTLFLPRGLWGLIDRRRGLSVVPLRHRIRPRQT